MLTKVLAFVLLCTCAAYAQVPSRAAFFGQFLSTGGTPEGPGDYGSVITNLSGVPVAWYPVNGNYGAGGLANRGNWTALPTITNANAPTLVSGGWNGLDYLAFDGAADVMASASFSSGVYNCEVVFVMAYTNSGASTQYHFMGSTNGVKYLRFGTAAQALRGYDSASANVLGMSNTLMVVDLVCGRTSEGSGVMIYTNGVVATTSAGNGSTNWLSILVLGANADLTSLGQFSLGEMVVCQTNLGPLESTLGEATTSVNRSNLTWALSAKYGITNAFYNP